MSDYVMTVDQQIDDVSAKRPHFVLLGAGASRAALPNGDKNGRQVPLLKEVAQSLMLEQYFPDDLKVLAHDDFEAAYSKLFDLGSSNELDFIDHLVRDYFSSLELPNEPNLYDILLLSLRPKDVIFTFNWDPFLIQAIHRLQKHHLSFNVAKTFFLHGNVAVGYCENDNASGVAGRKCKKCGVPFAGSKLLFPVEHKNYNADSFIRREWDAASSYLKNAAMFTVFGYSAPVTDREAVELLKKAWGRGSKSRIGTN